ncbi:spore coat polysaccharide biosynthesis predicted glycosyltransferase SpsG [Streptosporangium becharense]|uniref:Spore coat polysaccharide biosynthesis predicted glycosyltransferase SpsG n=1 Tax=Streptosporangium becharense TaxID=1816182 RepID=A0A7W9IF52_9ACTN|nr:glycosyltransferase [Streptosporangium becharense]MBB2909530.1 spore coat polysaccharide biosynthesis predicted glycosyltransferase SpsG [Streptosporangium becharense]MBB5819513.1 spore coat polysaccharide biosynthesis predicted glycosyltransferase SpsG [Streptosporangium becharense]
MNPASSVNPASRAAPRVGIRCDAGPLIGVGHLVRCVALAEELVSRGAAVTFLGDLGGLAWASDQLTGRRLPLLAAGTSPGGLAAQALALGLDAVVLDSYTIPPATGETLRAAGLRVAAVIDGDPRGQVADLYVDQNLGAEERDVPLPEGAVRLAGARYVLLRDAVRRLRAVPAGSGERPGGERGAARAGETGGVVEGVAGETGGAVEGVARETEGTAEGVAGETGKVPVTGPPRVLCFFGGTDAAGMAHRWADTLAAVGVPFSATLVSPRPLPARPGITVVPPTDGLPELMASADLVITAAGTSCWELLYLGVPAALVWVADNQLTGYEALVGRELAAGLGPGCSAAGAVPLLRELLTRPALRARYAERGRGLVDGRGRERVAGALLDGLRRRGAGPR